MNTEFDIDRFMKVLKKDFHSVWPTFGIMMLILALIPAAMWLFCITWIDGHTALNVCWFLIPFCFFLATITAPSRIYKSCNLPNRGIHFAMLPASKKEKFSSMMLVTIVVPLVLLAVMIAFYSTLTFIQQQSFVLDEPARLLKELDYTFSTQTLLLSVLYYLANTSVFFFTNTLFKRHKVTKTILWSMALSFVASIAGLPFLITSSTNIHTVIDSPQTLHLVFDIILLLWTIGFYYGAYYRLKRMNY